MKELPESKAIKEVARAAAEIAIFGTKSIEVTEKILRHIAETINYPVSEVVGIVGDRLRFYRWKQQLSLFKKSDELLKARGSNNIRPVPVKFALPLIEYASLEEEDLISSIWINLLSNARDADAEFSFDMLLVDIAKSLSEIDALILNEFAAKIEDIGPGEKINLKDIYIGRSELVDIVKKSENDILISIYNLFRLACLKPARVKHEKNMVRDMGDTSMSLTPLGYRFLCSINRDMKFL